MDTAIGGYFALELQRRNRHYHAESLRLSTGRGTFALILDILKPTRVHLPYYICNVVIEPLVSRGVEFRCLSINSRFEYVEEPVLLEGEYLLYNDYFGCKGKYLKHLMKRYGERLIVDATQSFFRRVHGECFSFNSVRKFFGTPDGSYLTVPKSIDPPSIEQFARFDNYEMGHLLSRLSGSPESGYDIYKRYEVGLDAEIRRMSILTEWLMQNQNYRKIISKRRDNYLYLNDRLARLNALSMPLDHDDVPFCYPFLPVNSVTHEEMVSRRVYVTRLWLELPQVSEPRFVFEDSLAKKLLPLPVDHRYSDGDMQRICDIIESFS